MVFQIETAIWFALQILPGFYMECYTGLKWVKRENSLPQILNLVCQNFSKEVLPAGLKIQACVLGEGQLNALPPRTKGLGIFVRQILSQNATAISLQNATKVYLKMR